MLPPTSSPPYKNGPWSRRRQKSFMTVTCKFWVSGPKWPPPPSWPPTLIKRVSICSEFKQLSACTNFMPSNAIPDELQGKNWFTHGCALTTCLVHKSSQHFCQSTFLLQSCNLCITHCVNCKFQIKLLVICLNTPPWPTWGHSMHLCCQAPSPLIQTTQQRYQSTGLELRVPKI